MIVCHCQGVSDREIRRAVHDGALGCGAVARACGAMRDCGGCLRLVEEIIDQERAPDATSEAPSSLAHLAVATR
jgi:bacterioferritin-associated ferredoxin